MKGRLTSITLCYHTSFEKIGWGNIACVAWPYRNPGVYIFGLGSSQKRIYIKELSHHIHWWWNDSNSHRWICCRNSFDYGEANQNSDWGLNRSSSREYLMLLFMLLSIHSCHSFDHLFRDLLGWRRYMTHDRPFIPCWKDLESVAIKKVGRHVCGGDL